MSAERPGDIKPHIEGVVTGYRFSLHPGESADDPNAMATFIADTDIQGQFIPVMKGAYPMDIIRIILDQKEAPQTSGVETTVVQSPEPVTVTRNDQ